MWYEEPLYDDRVEAYAEEHGLDSRELDWHLEAEHGWERHNTGYGEAIEGAANCLRLGTCNGEPVNEHLRKVKP